MRPRAAVGTGDVNMCVAENEFKIVGVRTASARGFQRNGFKEYDTGRQGSWDGSAFRHPRHAGKPELMENGTGKSKSSRKRGPASADEQMIQKLHEAGARSVPNQQSHASHEVMRTLIRTDPLWSRRAAAVRSVSCRSAGAEAARGKFAEGKVELKDRPDLQRSTTAMCPATAPRLSSASGDPRSGEAGHRLLIDHGKLHLRAEKSDAKSIVTTGLFPGTRISDRKGGQPARYAAWRRRADSKGPPWTRRRAATERSIGVRFPSSSALRTLPRFARSPAVALD